MGMGRSSLISLSLSFDWQSPFSSNYDVTRHGCDAISSIPLYKYSTRKRNVIQLKFAFHFHLEVPLGFEPIILFIGSRMCLS